MSEETYHEDSLWRRLRLTPLRDLMRGRVTGRLDWRTRIDQAELPEPAKEVVRRVVKKSRLWRLEKADVADELIAHFADGLESVAEDTSPFARGLAQERREDASTLVKELIAEFGDAKQAARLIRRAKKRNRPIVWKMMKRSLQAVGVMIVLYAAATGWFALGKPDISVNYLAKLNAPAKAVPKDERAWPIYREALLKYGIEATQAEPLYVKDEDGNASRLARPTDAQWSKAVAFLEQHRDLLDLIRKGASKPGLGLVMKYSESGYSERDRKAFGWSPPAKSSQTQSHAKQSGEAWKTHSLIDVLLPQLGMLRRMARLMIADTRLAATQDDTARTVADWDAILGMANQAREHPVLISQLVADSILILDFEQIADLLAKHLELFNNRQLVHLAHRLASLDRYGTMDLSADRMFAYDMFQRIYDKNGNVTAEGLRFIHNLSDLEDLKTPPMLGSSDTSVVTLPLENFLMADRREMTRQYERLMGMTEAYYRLPYWKQLRTKPKADQIVKRWTKSPWMTTRYWPLTMMMPAISAAGKTTHKTIAVRDALEVAIALELYKREHHGAYPDTLAALVPQYMPKPPIDHSTGKPLLYKVVNGQPLLYGRGMDGDDDGGVPGKSQVKYGGWPIYDKQGDWVLYPRVGE